MRKIGEEGLSCVHGFQDAGFAFDPEINLDVFLVGYQSGQPTGAMSLELIHDKDPVRLWIIGERMFDMVHEVLFGPRISQAGTEDFSCFHVDIGDHAAGAMPGLVKLLVCYRARFHRARGRGSFQSLSAGFLIRADQMGPVVL